MRSTPSRSRFLWLVAPLLLAAACVDGGDLGTTASEVPDQPNCQLGANYEVIATKAIMPMGPDDYRRKSVEDFADYGSVYVENGYFSYAYANSASWSQNVWTLGFPAPFFRWELKLAQDDPSRPPTAWAYPRIWERDLPWADEDGQGDDILGGFEIGLNCSPDAESNLFLDNYVDVTDFDDGAIHEATLTDHVDLSSTMDVTIQYKP